MTEKVIRDGKVAVIVSPGIGGGWHTWNKKGRTLLFDPTLVAAIERRDLESAKARAKELRENVFDGGLHQAIIEWVPVGTRFFVDEYDGSEILVTEADIDWVVA